MLDCLLVAAGTAVFAAVSYKMLPKLTFSKPVLVTAATLPLLLWAVYQYLLLVYGGATAGMRIASIRLSTFNGKSPCRRKRRQRVMALYFSMASFVMGASPGTWGERGHQSAVCDGSSRLRRRCCIPLRCS